MNEISITRSILVVDDQPNWQHLLNELLIHAGYRVRCASNYDEAIAYLDSDSFDMVILDIRLVDEESYNVLGLELLHRVKEHEPRSKAVILTGYPESIHEGVLERHRADGMILKVPSGDKFRGDDFLAKVSELLR